MSAALEAYLARLYLDADARRAFATDPSAAARAGLDAADLAALQQLDRVGLELMARSLAAKRRASTRPGWLARLRALVVRVRVFRRRD
jgi:hypothetical protein